MLKWHVTAYRNRERLRNRETGIIMCPSSIMAYNAVKLFGAGVMKMKCKFVLGMFIIDNVVSEHTKYEMENMEAQAKVKSR